MFVQNWGLEGGKISCLKSLLLPHYTFHLTSVESEKGQSSS